MPTAKFLTTARKLYFWTLEWLRARDPHDERGGSMEHQQLSKEAHAHLLMCSCRSCIDTIFASLVLGDI